MRQALSCPVERKSVSHTVHIASSRCCSPTHAEPPTNHLSNGLTIEARCCQVAPVSRVPEHRQGHLWNANPVFAGPEGPLRAASSLAGMLSHTTKYNAAWLRDVAKATQPSCLRRSRQPLVRKGVGLDGTAVFDVFQRTQKAKLLIKNSRVVAVTGRPLDCSAFPRACPQKGVDSTPPPRADALAAAKHRMGNLWRGPRATISKASARAS